MFDKKPAETAAENPADWERRTLAYLAGQMNREEAADLEADLEKSEAARSALSRSRAVLDAVEISGSPNIARKARAVLETALDARATDLQISAEAETVTIRMRVGGAWHEAGTFPKALHQGLVDWWKIQINAQVAEQRVPQNGTVVLRHENQNFDGRVVVLPQFWGEAVHIHLTNRSQIRLELDALGLRREQKAALRQMTNFPNGLVLTSGPKASGKSTLLCSLLHDLQTRGDTRNFVSVEEPVEITLPGVGQTRANPAAGLGFADVLRAFLLAETDVIYCSEIRNPESARLVTDAALGGALVLSTVAGARSAWDGVAKLRQMGIEDFLLAACLAGLVGQRLVRTFAPETPLIPDTPHLSDLDNLGLSPVEDGPFLQAASGPENGFASARTALFEIVSLDAALADALSHGANTDELWAMSCGANGQSLRDEAALLVRQNKTTVREAVRALAGYGHNANGILPNGAASDFVLPAFSFTEAKTN